MVTRKHSFDTPIIVALFCIFVFAGAAMLLSGVQVWQRTEQTMTSTNDTQTALLYLANKVRQNDSDGGVSLTELDGTSALAMQTEIDGFTYVTYLYCYDGQLCELFTPSDVQLTPDCGVVIMEAAGLEFSEENGLIRAEFTGTDGQTASVLLGSRSEPAS